MPQLKALFNRIFRRRQLKEMRDEMNIRASVADDKLFVAASHPVLSVLAQMLTELYESASESGSFVNGANFVTVNFVDHANMKGYELTIQRWGRPSPSVVAANFRKALDLVIANPNDAVDIAVRALDANNYPTLASANKAE